MAATVLATPGIAWPFERIYVEFKTPITNYLYHLVSDHELADDLTQDTFLKAFKSLPKMDASLKLQAWLYRIATNCAYDALRRRKLIAWLSWEDLDDEPADLATPDPQDEASNADNVRQALAQMPEPYRRALLLYEVEGFSFGEVTAILHYKPSGGKMLLSRARNAFREQYQRLAQQEAGQ